MFIQDQNSTLCQSLEGLIQGEPDFIANLANASSLLFHSMEHVNWLGFYLLKEGTLVLGPFQGKTACIRIALGRGVCGTAAEQRKTILVKDVHEFPGHIACDAASRSELVVPMIKNGELIGVLDIDSPRTNRFDEKERILMEECVSILMKHLQ